MYHFELNQKAIDAFAAAFPNRKPQFLAAAPGRVNIIGEHVDHQGYSVFPCAINQKATAIVAVEKGDAIQSHDTPFFQIRHVDAKFTPRDMQDPSEMTILPEPHWTNYVVAGYLGVKEYIEKNRSPESLNNYRCQVLVSGDIPPAAGLSSSSAVVVMASMIFNEIEGANIAPKDLANLCADCERYVGTAGGGMDQASILLSRAGFAQLISFNPLTTREVPLPEWGVFVVTNTCKEAPKAVSFAKMYNKRVFELKTAAYQFLKAVDPDRAAKMSGADLVSIQWKPLVEKYLNPADLLASLATINKHVKDSHYTKDEVLVILGKDKLDYLLHHRVGEAVWTQNDEFWLFNRVKHVLTETKRVSDFVDTCENPPKDEEELLKKLGALMNEAGVSVRDDFDASCDEINEVVEIALRNGAYGCRLTGAGWGGCTVALVRKEKTAQFIEMMRKEYFDVKVRGGCKATDGQPLKMLSPDMAPLYEDALFLVSPASGASITYF